MADKKDEEKVEQANTEQTDSQGRTYTQLEESKRKALIAQPIQAQKQTPSQIVKEDESIPTTKKTDIPKENAIDRLLNERIKQNEAEGKQIESMNPDSPEEQKRRKRNAIIASIADGLSAMSNLYFATKGAPAPSKEAVSISAVQRAQNEKDRNTYLELLQSWRKRNNELLNSYADYQSTIAKNKLASDKLDFERDREARLYAKDEAQRAYQSKLMELKQQGADDLRAHREAQLAYKEKELEARKEYWANQTAIGRERVNKQGRDSNTTYTYRMEQGKPLMTGKETTYGK